MLKRPYPLVVAFFACAACSAGTDPAVKALDGEWSSGHTVMGLEFGIALSWTQKFVVGAGSYIVFPPSAQCGSAQIAGPGTVALAATRSPSSEIQGHVTFANGTPLVYEGTLTNMARPGFERIDGFLIAADGTQCALTLFHAAIP
jgi:hypothetical protein